MERDPSGAPLWAEMRWIVPAAAAVLLLPPVLTLFDAPIRLFGVPLLPLYIFAVWAAAIILCASTARRVHKAPQRPDRTGP